MKKGNVENVQGGFSVKPTTEYTAKQERETRMTERKGRTDLSRATNAEIFEYLNDIADRQAEIYNLIKKG